MTLDQIELLVLQLSEPQRLRLAARICDGLADRATDGESARARRSRIEAALARCDRVAGAIGGAYDSAEDVRRSRLERAAPQP